MSRCGNGTSRLFFCARSCRAVPTRATEFKSHDWPVCRERSWIARKTFLHIWKTQTARSFTRNPNAKDRRKSFLNRKSRSSICCEIGGPASLSRCPSSYEGGRWIEQSLARCQKQGGEAAFSY